MAGEVYQAQILKNFFDTITGPDRNLTRIHMCVLSVAKLRHEPAEEMTRLIDQLRKSRERRELSVDILDYMCDVAADLQNRAVLTAFGVAEIKEMAEEFSTVSLDTL